MKLPHRHFLSVTAHFVRIAAAVCAGLLFTGPASGQSPLTTIEYKVVGTQLKVSPPTLSVPKGVAGSIFIELNTEVEAGAVIEATLRGPSFPARKLIGQVNQPLLLPPLPLVGDYQLDDIKLVYTETGETKMEASPSSVPVHVFDEVLVSRVTSRPLTLDEIQEKGIVIDQQNFRAVEFEVGFVLDGKTIPVKFPVVAPSFRQSTEIIPTAELEKRLAEADEINRQLAGQLELPAELETARLNVDIQGINFQFTEEGDSDLALKIPPIPALVVIPGNIGFLNQFFSVQIFTENAAPNGSGLSVNNVKAEMVLPPGPDKIPATDFEHPGDDPLRFARVGTDKVIKPIQAVVQAGPDGKVGTSDDVARLFPGEGGQGEFLVEGLQEGLHVMDVKLTADLDGLAAGTVKITGKAAGSVLVRNPKFSLAFSHPRTIRAGEPYDAFVTILNTSTQPANLVSVTLNRNSISGGILESEETVQLGTILPGQTGTARYHIRSQRTGAISFSNLTTSDDSVVGRFRLQMGIDERGVALSADSIGMPDFANSLPTNLVAAANRVLGQALSVATAPQLPPGILGISKSVVTRRVLELAEAGQRLRYHDTTSRVLTDLLLDWEGARLSSDGFAQIINETNAGREWREAVSFFLETADGLNGVSRLLDRAADLAGRSEPWAIFAVDRENGTVRFGNSYRNASGVNGVWSLSRPGTNSIVEWFSSNAVQNAQLALLITATNGTGKLLRWTVPNLLAGSCVRIVPGDGLLQIDVQCDGTVDSNVPPSITPITENPPELISAIQDMSVDAGRPLKVCPVPQFRNYGTVLAVLFSKPTTQEGANVPSAYTLDNGNSAQSVQVQPGGRVALLNMRQPVGAIHPRMISVKGVADLRGNVITANTIPIETDLRSGVAVRGLVVRSDGTPAPGVPVTLTMYDEVDSGLAGCQSFVVRVSQIFTDDKGAFQYDFVLSGMGYSVSATDTSGLSPDVIALILGSAAGDQFNAQKLNELASSPTARNTLLEAFAVGALPQAIAKAEGLDRAVLRDFIEFNSSRQGTDVPVALRFRGRGTVQGQVLAADGVSPASGTAVNLFPDPDSRELGRGIFSDNNGRFAFFGVPLGVFSIEASSSNGLSRTVTGVINTPGQNTNIKIVLSSSITPRTVLAGRVVESDDTTGHAQASIFIGRFIDGKFGNVVGAATADSDGFWSANIPSGTYDLVAISLDGKRKGQRLDIAAPPGVTNQITIALQGRSVVVGRVETSTGAPVPNAVVAGGDAIVRTDTNGLFRLTGVPTGPNRTISAALEKNPAAGIDFTHLGSAAVDVVPGIDNFAVVRLQPAGRIVGRVLDETGRSVPNATVAIPEQGGFRWVSADAQGNYKFEPLELRKFTLSAPAPATANTDVSSALKTLAERSSTQDELLAAVGEALTIFTGAADPLLNGEGAQFNPLAWGFTETALTFDGQTAVADIQFLPAGTISGKVLNGQGVPIGARVRLTGIGPALNGAPTIVLRGERNSDPALGTFEFPRQALVGDWGLQSASPFFPVVLSTSGRTSELAPDETNVVLQFPATRDINGRVSGFVFNPDGTRGRSNINVKISFGNDFVIRTDTNGFFDTQVALPQGGYMVEANDTVSGLRGQASVDVKAGLTNRVDVRLLGRGALRVRVVQADGSSAPAARVKIEQGSFPQDRFEGTADGSGAVLFQNLFEGAYAASADLVAGPTTISGRSPVQVVPGGTNEVTVILTPTATIRGVFLQRDLLTPVQFAQVFVGQIGFATTDTNGVFEVKGVPLGTYRLVSQNPVTGIGASLNVTLALNGEVRNVQLVEQARGEIAGSVINSYGTGIVPGAMVTLNSPDGFIPSRSVTTGPDGQFSFPGAPAGSFSLQAEDPATRVKGQNSGVLGENVTRLEINVALQPLTVLAGTVLRPDGKAPATNATVRLQAGGANFSADTDAAGRVSFRDLPLGDYTVTAQSRILGEDRSITGTNITLSSASADLALTLRGVGSVSGTVFGSDGVTPTPGAQVTVKMNSPFLVDEQTALTDNNGRYRVQNIPLGAFSVSAVSQALGATVSGEILLDGQNLQLDLRLGASGAVQGRLVRADGATAARDIDVALTFNSQSGLPGRAFVRTDASGNFSFANIPLGTFDLEAIASSFNGIARLRNAISSNAQTLNLGSVRLDEDDPRVVAITPPATAVNVPIDLPINLVFNEPLDPATLKTNGVYLRSTSGTTPRINLSLIDDTNGLQRIVRIQPLVPLRSQQTYEVIAIDGDRKDALGGQTASGPRDLVGRPLTVPFLSSFTTADQDPPLLVSLFPANSAKQIDPRTVMRLTFNEPIQTGGFSVTLSSANGPVSGTASVGLNGLVLTFTPAAPLQPNTRYNLRVSGVRDLAGNLFVSDVFTSSFDTLDTLGPEIATLRLADDVLPIAGGTVPVEAILGAPELGAAVRFTQDFNNAGVITNAPFRANIVLPQNGSTTVRAIASDSFGNDGPFAELKIAVVSNQPPAVQLARTNPPDGPLGSGDRLILNFGATDDLGISSLALTASGSLNFSTNFPDGSARSLSFDIPANALGTVSITARATDQLGVSAEKTILVPLVDLVAPNLSILKPASNSLITPANPLVLEVLSLDNSTNVVLDITVTGAFTNTQSLTVSAPPNVPQTNRFTVPVPAGVVGLIRVQIVATDPSTNRTTNERVFIVPDLNALRFLSVAPTNDAAAISPWIPQVRFTFNKALDPSTVNLQNVRLSAATNSIPIAIELANNDSNIVLRPSAPLNLGTRYVATLSSNIADLLGNHAFATDSSSAFTTVRLLSSRPTNGTLIVPGQQIAVAASLETGGDADSFSVTVSGESVVVPAVNGTTFTNSVRLSPAATEARIQIAARRNGLPSVDLPDINLSLRGRDLDDDNDGWLNGFEVDRGMNPFVADLDSADFDRDGVSNGQERTLGTDPGNADTDGDGLTDGQEVARGTNPLNRDTDGDGLADNVDPDPLKTNVQIAFNAPTDLTITEGQSTNFTIEARSAAAEVVLLDLTDIPSVPTFVSVLSQTSENTSTNGAATLKVELNPLHDAAGNYTLKFRSAARNGDSGTFTVTVHVINEPALQVTRWLTPTSGNWTDASRWSAGVPAAGNVGIIDATGTDYRVTIDSSVTAAGVVLNSTNAVLRPSRSATFDAPIEIRLGQFNIDESTTLTLNRALANRDRMRWISRNNVFNVQGAGHVQNFGVWDIFADPNCSTCGAESTVRVPVVVPVGGKLLLSDGLVDFTVSSALTVSGQLDVEPSSRLRIDGSFPARDLILNPGSLLTGTGRIQIEGNSRLVLGETITVRHSLLVDQPARVVGFGELRLATDQSLFGNYDVPVHLTENAVVNFGNVQFNQAVVVDAGATMTVNASATVNLNGVLTNFGTLNWISRNNVFNLQGAGRVENSGLWQIIADPNCLTCGAESTVRLPVNVLSGGKLSLTNGLLDFTVGSSLTVAGELEILGSSRLRFDGSNPPRDLTLLSGSALSGDGVIQMEGSTRLVTPGDLDSTVGINITDSAQLIVPGTYTVRTSRSMRGTIDSGALIVTTNATITASSANFLGRVELQDGARLDMVGGTVSFQSNIVVRAGARWDVDASTTVVVNSPVTNSGTMQWISRNNVFNLQGSGTLENFGLWQIFADPACLTCGGESVVRVPVNVPVGGKLSLTNALVDFTAPSSLTVAGELEVSADSRLRVDGSNPPRDLTLATGSILSGNGTLQMEGSSRLVTPGDLDTPMAINITDSAQLVVPGTYTIRGSRSMRGTIDSSFVLISNGATLTASSANFLGRVEIQNGSRLDLVGGTVNFLSNVVVRAGARWDVDASTTVVINSPATNNGTMQWISRNNVFNLQGSGTLENFGLWQIFADPACLTCGGESVVRVPVNVPVGGKLSLTNALVDFTAPSSLTVAGELEVSADSRLRVDGSNPPRDLTLAVGSSVKGGGTVLFEGSNQMLLGGNIILGGSSWQFTQSSSIRGNALLTIGPGAAVSFDHSSSYAGSINVKGDFVLSGSSSVYGIDGALTLDAGGTINNAGVVHAGSFVNSGGTIVGNTPTIVAPLVISSIRFGSAQLSPLSAHASKDLILTWTGPSGATYAVESTRDFKRWTVSSSQIKLISPTRYESRIAIPADGSVIFFRIRTAEK